MKATRQLVSLCLVIGMTIGGNLSTFAQGPAYAQTAFYTPHRNSPAVAHNEIKELRIGDKVPDIEFSMLNYPSKKARLSDFAGKLVILDFWATWCTSCLHHFPKMDSLQKEFDGQIQVILLDAKSTGDNYNRVEQFMNNWKDRHAGFQLPTAVMDSVADKYFSHRFIPHYVWIGLDGNVIAVTAAEQISADNIAKLLEDGKGGLPIKKDINVDRPLFLSSDIEINELTQYSIFIKGRVAGLPSGNKLRKFGNIVRGRAMMNNSIGVMYETMIQQLSHNLNFSDKRVILDVKDFSKDDDLYSYELIVPVSQAKNLYKYMLEDLNRNSNYYGRFEKRIVRSYSLVMVNNSSKIQTAGGAPEDKLFDIEKRYLKNEPITHLVNFLNTWNSIQFPVVDKTNYSDSIDIKLPSAVKSIEELNNALQRFGLNLISEENEVEMFILTEKN